MGSSGAGKILAALIVGTTMAGCAASGAIDYLKTEYGGQERDGWVNLGTELEPQAYSIWIHKTKPKMNVQTSIGAAAKIGAVQGATYGAVDAAPVQPVFERAALKWFEDKGQAGCRVSNPVKIHQVVYEFDYECRPIPPAQKKKRG